MDDDLFVLPCCFAILYSCFQYRKACEVTTADVELDSLLESTFGDLPYLKYVLSYLSSPSSNWLLFGRRSVSFPDGKINTLDFYALMNAIEKYKPNVEYVLISSL